MPIGSPFTFRLLIGLARELIFAIDDLSAPSHQPLAPGPTSVHIEVKILSSSRTLVARFVEPASNPLASVLLLHGIGDRILYWHRAQHHLADHGIASLIFHYSGFGASEGRTLPAYLEADTHAAYTWLCTRLTLSRLPFLLGFSLGSGIASSVISHLSPAPSGLILSEPFTSLRHAARRAGGPIGFLHFLLPDIWRTLDNLGSARIPILIVHSDADALFPVAMAHDLYTAARQRGADVTLNILHGYGHNAVYLSVPEDYWAHILRFILAAQSAVPV